MSDKTVRFWNERSWCPDAWLYEFGRPFPQRYVCRLFDEVGGFRGTHMTDTTPYVYEPGAGTGRILIPLACHFGLVTFRATELTEAMLHVLRCRCVMESLTNVETELGDARNVTLDRQVDGIIVSSLCHLVADWRSLLRHLAAQLSDDGRFYVLGESGDIYDEANGIATARSGRAIGFLQRFFGEYHRLRALHGIAVEPGKQVGARWNCENTDVAEELEFLGMREAKRASVEWLQTFGLNDLLLIVASRPYSSMFCRDEDAYARVSAAMGVAFQVSSSWAAATSHHRATLRVFSKP